MTRLVLHNVPVRLQAEVSAAHAAALEAAVRSQVDLRGLLKQGLIAGSAEERAAFDAALEAAGEAYGEVRARFQLERGKAVLRATATAAVGEKLQTYRLDLQDGVVVAIHGGGVEA